jgi:hypothetical protein
MPSEFFQSFNKINSVIKYATGTNHRCNFKLEAPVIKKKVKMYLKTTQDFLLKSMGSTKKKTYRIK